MINGLAAMRALVVCVVVCIVPIITATQHALATRAFAFDACLAWRIFGIDDVESGMVAFLPVT